MTEDELRERIGNKKFEEIKVFVEKLKAEGKSPNELKVALQAKFRTLKGIHPEDAIVMVPPAPKR